MDQPLDSYTGALVYDGCAATPMSIQRRPVVATGLHGKEIEEAVRALYTVMAHSVAEKLGPPTGRTPGPWT
jgi:hypothetical protein